MPARRSVRPRAALGAALMGVSMTFGPGSMKALAGGEPCNSIGMGLGLTVLVDGRPHLGPVQHGERLTYHATIFVYEDDPPFIYYCDFTGGAITWELPDGSVVVQPLPQDCDAPGPMIAVIEYVADICDAPNGFLLASVAYAGAVACEDGAAGSASAGSSKPIIAPADVTDDGRIDVEDLVAVIVAWGPCAGCDADINDDGTVDVGDLVAVLIAWAPCV